MTKSEFEPRQCKLLAPPLIYRPLDYRLLYIFHMVTSTCPVRLTSKFNLVEFPYFMLSSPLSLMVNYRTVEGEVNSKYYDPGIFLAVTN